MHSEPPSPELAAVLGITDLANPNDVVRALGVGCEDCNNQGTLAGLCTSIRCRPAGHPLGNRVESAVTGSNGDSTGFAAPFKKFLKNKG